MPSFRWLRRWHDAVDVRMSPEERAFREQRDEEIESYLESARFGERGPTTDRPPVPTDGMLRTNTTTGEVEAYDSSTSAWVPVGWFRASGARYFQLAFAGQVIATATPTNLSWTTAEVDPTGLATPFLPFSTFTTPWAGKWHLFCYVGATAALTQGILDLTIAGAGASSWPMSQNSTIIAGSHLQHLAASTTLVWSVFHASGANRTFSGRSAWIWLGP